MFHSFLVLLWVDGSLYCREVEFCLSVLLFWESFLSSLSCSFLEGQNRAMGVTMTVRQPWAFSWWWCVEQDVHGAEEMHPLAALGDVYYTPCISSLVSELCWIGQVLGLLIFISITQPLRHLVSEHVLRTLSHSVQFGVSNHRSLWGLGWT